MSQTASELKAEILRLTRKYSALAHKANRPGVENSGAFVPGQTTVPYAGASLRKMKWKPPSAPHWISG